VVAGEHGEQAAAERVLRPGEPGPQPDHPAGGGLRPVQDRRLGHRSFDQRRQLLLGRHRGRPLQRRRPAALGRRHLAPADPRHHQADGRDDHHDQQNQDGD
jgi:hypothetical protein